MKQTTENHPDGAYILSEDFRQFGTSGWQWVERFDGDGFIAAYKRTVRTNGHGEGLFVRQRDGTWRQETGTCQYSLPFNRRSAIARRRRDIAEVSDGR